MTANSNQHWGGENHTSVSRFVKRIVVLGKKQTKIATDLSVTNHGNKGRPFRLAVPRADYCDNSAERKLLTQVKRA